MIPWDELRLSQVEAGASGCPDACAADVVSLVAEVRRLTEQVRIASEYLAELAAQRGQDMRYPGEHATFAEDALIRMSVVE